jgi:hypothetical protein
MNETYITRFIKLKSIPFDEALNIRETLYHLGYNRKRMDFELTTRTGYVVETNTIFYIESDPSDYLLSIYNDELLKDPKVRELLLEHLV